MATPGTMRLAEDEDGSEVAGEHRADDREDEERHQPRGAFFRVGLGLEEIHAEKG